jgi:hypothetical protein
MPDDPDSAHLAAEPTARPTARPERSAPLALPDLSNPLKLYLDRLAPSSRLTMTYVLQDAADRLGLADVDIRDVPWHTLQPGHVTALVATLRADDYAPNTTSLYVNAIRGVMNEAWRQDLITHDQLLKIRSIPAVSGWARGETCDAR